MMYDEMISLNLVPDLNTANSMIQILPFSKSPVENQIEMMMKRLTEMRDFGIRPNLRTFNLCLNLLHSIGVNVKYTEMALDILKEMELLKIEPSLATYSYVLSIVYPNRNVNRNTMILEQIIDRVEKISDKLEWRDKDDCLFFRVAMEKCLKVQNTAYAKRINAILFQNNNIRFLNDHVQSSKY